jgi:hypothetical protein
MLDIADIKIDVEIQCVAKSLSNSLFIFIKQIHVASVHNR